MVSDTLGAVARFQTLQERLNEIDPHYYYRMADVTVGAHNWPPDVVFSVRIGDVQIDVYPKYPGAVQDRPFSIRAMITIGEEDLPILEAIGYGLEATLPQRMISSVTIDLPAGLGGIFSGGELNIGPATTEMDEPLTLALRIMAEDKLVASYPVYLKERTGGPRGFVLTGTDSTGWLAMRLTVNAVDGDADAELRVIPQSGLPTALVPLFQWLDVFQPTRQLYIRWPEGFEFQSEISRPFWIEESPLGFVEALAYLQLRFGLYEDMPFSLSNKEARDIVTVAALLKGESIDLKWTSLNLNIHPSGPGLKALENGEAQALLFYEDISLQLQGEKVPIGRVQTHIPSARLADIESVHRDLASGLVPTLRLVPGGSDKARKVLVPGSC